MISFIIKLWWLCLFIFILIIMTNLGDQDNQHKCQLGHQLRAMAGYKFEKSNEASLFQCEKMEDHQPILVRGTKKKWSEFKKDHPDWDFGNKITENELLSLRSKFLDVWGKVGKLICRKYSMDFVTNNTQIRPTPFHYILLLDASGSMGGEPWRNLLEGVKEFIEIRIESNTEDRVTIITFDHNVKRPYFNSNIKLIDTNKIEFTNGRTDFCKPFQMVIDTIRATEPPNMPSSPTKNLDFIIIFMSDGQASFPGTQLDTLLTIKTKIHAFWTVALGQTEMDVLEKINEKMGGTFTELKNSADLIQVYAEIARH